MGLQTEQLSCSSLPRYTYHFSLHVEGEVIDYLVDYLEMRRIDDDHRKDFQAFDYSGLRISDQHVDFKHMFDYMGKRISSYGLIGLITRNGRVIFSDNGNHPMMRKAFDELCPFLFTQVLIEGPLGEDRWSIRLIDNQKYIKNAPLPTFAQFMQAVEFFIRNLSTGKSEEDEKILLTCKLKVINVDGVEKMIDYEYSIRQWQLIFQSSESLFEKLKEDPNAFH